LHEEVAFTHLFKSHKLFPLHCDYTSLYNTEEEICSERDKKNRPVRKKEIGKLKNEVKTKSIKLHLISVRGVKDIRFILEIDSKHLMTSITKKGGSITL